MTVKVLPRNGLITILILLAISPGVYAFEFPWDPKEYKTYNECMNVSPKTLNHKEFLDDLCTRLFITGNPIVKSRKFLFCARERVMKTDSNRSARKEIFSCASSYPPKNKETPLNIAANYFPTAEELSERRAAEAQDREISRKQDALKQQLMQPICTFTGDILSCL